VPRYSPPPPPPPQPPAHQPGRAVRAVALTAVSVGVLVLAAAAFVLSYSGIHAVARQAGVSAALARGYPVIFDALLVIACAAVLSLRGAGAVSRLYAWLSLVVLLGATAGADALHSTGTTVPHRAAALAAAIIPWILLLIGFGLLLAMMRHFRLHRAAPPAPAPEARRPAVPAALPPPAPAPQPLPVPPLPVPPQAPSERAEPIPAAAGSARPAAAPAGPEDAGAKDPAGPAEEPAPEEIFAASPPDAGAAAAGPTAAGADAAAADAPAGNAAGGSSAPANGSVQEPAAARPPGPQPAFHRMWSSPTPPGDDEDGD
jgi:hypothetical protein